MEITPEILKGIILEYADVVDDSDDTEWRIPSFQKPHKTDKCYVNVEKCVAIDYIGNVGMSAWELIGELVEIDPVEQKKELGDFIRNWAVQNAVSVTSAIKREKKKKVKPVVERMPLPSECISPLDKSYQGNRARKYLRYDRGLMDDDIEKYHLKFCPDGDYAGRIIIPFIENDEVVWFQARSIYKDAKLRYKNPKGVERSMLVYNIDAIDRIAVIMEGPFDAMTVNGQAIMGSRLSDWQAGKIVGKKPERIILVPDNDFNKDLNKSVGYEGALASIEKLLEAGYPIESILVAFVEGGKDLNDLGKVAAYDCLSKAQPVNMRTLLQIRELGNVWNDEVAKHV